MNIKKILDLWGGEPSDMPPKTDPTEEVKEAFESIGSIVRSIATGWFSKGEVYELSGGLYRVTFYDQNFDNPFYTRDLTKEDVEYIFSF